jgi:hypothetical protein
MLEMKISINHIKNRVDSGISKQDQAKRIPAVEGKIEEIVHMDNHKGKKECL